MCQQKTKKRDRQDKDQKLRYSEKITLENKINRSPAEIIHVVLQWDVKSKHCFRMSKLQNNIEATTPTKA